MISHITGWLLTLILLLGIVYQTIEVKKYKALTLRAIVVAERCVAVLSGKEPPIVLDREH
jgi:hypothetical protein